jgi:S-ribosylhomocysteine lyase
MKKIASFSVDHKRLSAGIYISRIDGDVVTYDLRVCKPNTGELMDNVTMHSVEHMFATYVRNSEIAGSVLYFGPMGCQTGFYLCVRDSVTADTVLSVVKQTLQNIVSHSGEMYGASETECGNYRSLDLAAAKALCVKYDGILKNIQRIIPYSEV